MAWSPCCFQPACHLVFVTKYRKEVFTKEILDELQIIFEQVCHEFESELVEFDGEDDHAHLLVHYPPKVSISKLVNSLKGVFSRKIRQQYPSVTKNYEVVHCGHQVILQVVVAVLQLKLSASILNNKTRRIKASMPPYWQYLNDRKLITNIHQPNASLALV